MTRHAVRKLAWCCGGFAGAVFLAEYLLPPGALLWTAFGCALLALTALLLPGRSRMILLLVLLGAAMGGLRGWAQVRWTITPADALDGQTVNISARVVEYPDVYDTAEYVVVRLTQEGMPEVKCRLSSYDGGIAFLRPGDELTAEVKLRSARFRYGERTDRYSSKGIFLLGVCKSQPVVTGRWGGAFLYYPQTLACQVTDQCRRLFPADVSAFLAALLSGDKTDLYADEVLYSQMSKAGLSHVVAVSGMHISFLMGFVWLAAGNRRRTALAGMPLLLVFCALAGFTPSVTRAAFMQAYLLLAGLVDREGDAPTSLTVVLALLLAQNPSAAASVSLQLSFAATAGILLISAPVYEGLCAYGMRRWKPGKKAARLLSGCAGSLASTAGALLFTTPLTALHFGYVSIVSPVTNILCLWMVSILFVGGYCTVLLGAAIPLLGAAAGWILAWGARYIFAVTGLLCALPYPAVYTQNPIFLFWLVFVYGAFFVAWRLRPKGKPFQPVVPLCLSVLLLWASIWLVRADWTDDLTLTALDVGQGECIVVESGGSTVVVDCGSISSETNAGQIASQYLLSRGRRKVDALILTHLHRDHVNGAARLLASVDVGALILPAGLEDSGGELDGILTVAQKVGTGVYYLSEDSRFSLDKMEVILWAPIGREKDNERCMAVMAAQNGFEVLIPGDMPSYAEKRLAGEYDLPDMEVLVVSHHGSAYSTSEYLLDEIRPDTAIISVGYNSYGHPTEEVLQRLTERNIEIYRTDLEGNITIHGG